MCGISAHTLRYYEKIGLLPAVERTDSNHRRYSERDVAWIAFIKRLKATNMPLSEIQRYAELREQGEGSEEARMQRLSAHALPTSGSGVDLPHCLRAKAGGHLSPFNPQRDKP